MADKQRDYMFYLGPLDGKRIIVADTTKTVRVPDLDKMLYANYERAETVVDAFVLVGYTKPAPEEIGGNLWWSGAP